MGVGNQYRGCPTAHNQSLWASRGLDQGLDELLEICFERGQSRMLDRGEQFALADPSIGRLHVQAAQTWSVEQAKAYNAAAARLLAEYWRSALAFRSYRAPSVLSQ